MTGRVGFSFRVLDRSLKGCSGAGDGGERPISFSPKLWLRLWEPEVETGDRSGTNNNRENLENKQMWKLRVMSQAELSTFVYTSTLSMLLWPVPPRQELNEYTLHFRQTIIRYPIIHCYE